MPISVALGSPVTREGFLAVEKMFAASAQFDHILPKAMLKAARAVIVPPVKAATPRAKKPMHNHMPGHLRKGINAYDMKEFAAVRGLQKGQPVTPIRVGPARNDFWYAKWVVGGTKPHLIYARGLKRSEIRAINQNPKTLARFQNARAKGRKSLRFNGVNVNFVYHPGARPNPFLRAADGKEHVFIGLMTNDFMKVILKDFQAGQKRVLVPDADWGGGSRLGGG